MCGFEGTSLLNGATLRALIEQTSLTVYVARLDDVRSNVYASPALGSVLGYPADGWIADEELFIKVVHPDDRERLLAEHRRTRDSGEPFCMEYRMVARDGAIHWFRDEATVIEGGADPGTYRYGVLQEVTERKELEEGLRRSAAGLRRQHDLSAVRALEEAEKRYRNLVEQIPLVTYVDEPAVAPSMYISPQVEGLVGYSAEEWLADPDLFFTLLHPDDRERVVADHERVFATGQSSWSFEYRLVARDGRTVWIRDEAVVIKDDEGTPLYVQGFLMDMTERKEAEEALRKSEADLRRQTKYYESLVEISPVAVVTLDLEEVVTSWNPAAEELFGYSEAEALGQPIDDLILRSEALHEEGVSIMREAIANGSSHRITRRTRKDGGLVHVEVLVVPIRVDGSAVGSYAIYHDVSELHRQKQYFESLLEISPTAIVTVGLDARVTSWNPAAEKLFGYRREEALGRNVDDLIASAEELRAEAAEVNRRGSEGEVEVISRRTHKDGSLIDVQLRVAPVFVEGELVGRYGIYHDIREVTQARREAEKATEAKSAFLATMSHEIRTPMNAVIGMTELLLDTALTSEQRGFAEVLHTSGDSLLTIINDILDFSKIEAGRLELEHRPFVLCDCVESAIDIVAASASEKAIDLACLVDPETPAAFLGDPTRLRQILGNLLTNAVKFTDEGEVVLSVSCAAMPDGGERTGRDLYRLAFAVRDTGIGIPADRMDRLFQSFSQVDASTTRRYGGTGLGLAISKRLSEMMGGTMWAESRPGSGSTFHFTITAETAPSRVEPAPVPAELRGKRVLVVDDNAANREVVRRQSLGWGMVPRDTGSPAEALDWIRRGDPFDVAVIDMQMPEMDGLMVGQEIRRSLDARSLPLVLLTSLGRRKGDLETGVEFDAYLTKPIKASQLFDALTRVLGRAAEELPASSADEPRDAGTSERPSLRILVVEDNEVNQKLALLLLKKAGYGADLAVNGSEALEALRRGGYDVVLMDVEMPVMDGLEASRVIHREWADSERPRIIAMTANAMQGDREKCLAAGMDDYLSKPIHAEELVAALARCAPRAASAKSEQDAIVDAAVLDHLAATTGDSSFVIELVDTFLRGAPALLASLRSAQRTGEADELRRTAHTLKSNARTFGAAPLAELCQALETAAKAGATDEAAQLVGTIEDSYARVERVLAAMCLEGRRG